MTVPIFSLLSNIFSALQLVCQIISHLLAYRHIVGSDIGSIVGRLYHAVTEMKAKIRRVNQDPARPNVGLIVIDYLQLMTTGQRSENRVQEISSITRNLKIMAKELNVPIIALSQLSRAVEKQGNNSSHRPQLSDLRDSGSIEQDADCVLFLYRDSYYASQNPDGAEVDADTAECIVAKNRHGETSTVPLGWDGAHTRFMDVDFKR